MVSFRHKLEAGLSSRGIEVCSDLADKPYDVVLVIGGSRQLGGLWSVRRQGIPVVQRLDGMNWLHRLPSERRPFSRDWRHYLRAEYGNWILATIRARLATHIVYQSEFVRDWWERLRGLTPVPSTVIYNGVDLGIYRPDGAGEPPEDRYRLLLVEGSLMGGYEGGLKAPIGLVELLGTAHRQTLGRDVELMVIGRVSPAVQRQWDIALQRDGDQGTIRLNWAGTVPAERIPHIDRSAHLLYSADVNAACPNAVVEALACGLPVLAFDTGALPELVKGDAGRIVPYGGDPWRLDPPDVEGLARGALEILGDPERFRSAARDRAGKVFSLDAMVAAYANVFQNL